MFKQFEIILTIARVVLSAAFLTAIILRIRGFRRVKNARVSIWDSRIGLVTRMARLAMAAALPLTAAGLAYFLFIVAPPAAVVRDYAKILFIVALLALTLVETWLCFSVTLKSLDAPTVRRILSFIPAIVCAALAASLFPLILISLPYPGASECVMLDLPVRGTWLAGLAGASTITNGHLTNKYAIDILKIGPDDRLFKGKEKLSRTSTLTANPSTRLRMDK